MPTYVPSPNPGGQNRRLARNALADYITAQRIPGLDIAGPSAPTPQLISFEDRQGQANGAAQLYVTIPRSREERVAGTGPTDRGGKMWHADVILDVWHAWFDGDFTASEDDYDRIIDAVKDCLRGPGRDLARPEVVLQVGEWPRESSIEDEHDDPVWSDGTILRHGQVTFVYSQYMQQQP